MDFCCSKSKLKKVGEKLRHGLPLDEEEEQVFASFRMGHLPIVIETFRLADSVLPEDVEVGARLKRRQTIVSKLATRESEMELAKMNDIAGCRLVFKSMEQLKSLRDHYSSQMASIFQRRYDKDKYNYIETPKAKTGYRGIHEVFEEKDSNSSIRAKIEIQYRTAVQHSWATALEIWDNISDRGAKFGKERPDIQYLFSLLSELLWRFLDGGKTDPKREISNRVLFSSISQLESQYHVLEKLKNTTDEGFDLTGPSETNDFCILRRTGTGRLIVATTQQESIPELVFKKEVGEQGLDPLLVLASNYKVIFNNYLNDAKRFLRYVLKALTQARADIRWFKPDVFYGFLDDL